MDKKVLKDTFEILEAEDGETVLKLLHSTQVDVLLLDIIMPEPDGLEILKYMKERVEFEDIGILVATSTKEKTERAALSLGADDVVSKPYDPLVIKKRLANILAAKEAHAQHRLFELKETDSLVHARLQELSKQAGDSLTKIQKYADMIEANKENTKLISEFAEAVKTETEHLGTIVTDWE